MRRGTFNVRGLILEEKREQVAVDFENYNLDVLCIQETHLRGTSTLKLKGEKGKSLKLFYTGPETDSHHGVGILVESNRKILFNRINDRICYVKLVEENVAVICAYAPTNSNTRDNQDKTKEFYTALNDIVNNFPRNYQIFVAADFNCQIGTYHLEHPELIGQFYKGNKRDENSSYLRDFLVQNQLVVNNTKFKHKLAHRTTWECSNRYRYNPVRNQIDFILCKRKTFPSVSNSRSYNGFKTKSDHRLVISDIPKIKWHRIL